MIPNEWNKVVQSVLTRGQYFTWKSEFVDRGENLAANYRKNPTSKTASWTADKIFGKGNFAADIKQLRLTLVSSPRQHRWPWELGEMSLLQGH